MGNLNFGGMVSSEAQEKLNVSNHPGYLGAFTRDQAEGAISNGTRVRKAWSEPGDTTEVGQLGVVLGSIRVPPRMRDAPLVKQAGEYFYFVEWDERPRVAIGMIAVKIEAIQ